MSPASRCSPSLTIYRGTTADKWRDSFERHTDGSFTEGHGPWRAWQQPTMVYQFPTRRSRIHCSYIGISPQIGHCLISNEICAFPSNETHHMTWEFKYWALEPNCQGLTSTLPLVLCVTWMGHSHSARPLKDESSKSSDLLGLWWLLSQPTNIKYSLQHFLIALSSLNSRHWTLLEHLTPFPLHVYKFSSDPNWEGVPEWPFYFYLRRKQVSVCVCAYVHSRVCVHACMYTGVLCV